MTSQAHYVHGFDELEQRRLTVLNSFINERLLCEINLRGGERIVDFGAGLGQFTRALARAAGATRAVIGIERDARQIAEAIRQAQATGEAHLIELRLGDVVDPPLQQRELGGFDVAHARFILEHVPHPLNVVGAMVRAVRPGGRIVLADDDHEVMRLWPPLPIFERVWQAYMQTYAAAGNDPIVGRRLVELLHAAGAQPVRNTWVFFGSCAGDGLWRTIIENMAQILLGARVAIAAQPRMNEAVVTQCVSDLQQWSAQPNAAVWYAIAYAEGVRP